MSISNFSNILKIFGGAEPTEEEIARAAEQTRMVFQLTASAMRKAKEKAFKDVLADEDRRLGIAKRLAELGL